MPATREELLGDMPEIGAGIPTYCRCGHGLIYHGESGDWIIPQGCVVPFCREGCVRYRPMFWERSWEIIQKLAASEFGDDLDEVRAALLLWRATITGHEYISDEEKWKDR